MNRRVFEINDYYIRYDSGIGVLVYSCKNGLLYAYSDSYLNEVERKSLLAGNNLSDIINNIFSINSEVNSRLLPTPLVWSPTIKEHLKEPITINWLITKNCTHKCVYCYAKDVMDETDIIEEEDYQVVADKILKLNPLNVVLSGGEPLLNNKLASIIRYLSGKTGVVLDTNGYCLDKLKELVPILKENKVVVRISLDDLRIGKEYQTRKPKDNKKAKIDNLLFPLRSFEILTDNNISVIIQTVLTKGNANDIFTMGDKLYLLGVKVWRVFELQGFDENIEKYKPKKTEYFINQLFKQQKRKWPNLTLVYSPVSESCNNVILVLPNGTFYTQGNCNKEPINYEHPFDDVSASSHFIRYIN